MAEQKKLVLRRKINDVLYDLMVKTITDQVYTADGTKTLTTVLSDLQTAIDAKATGAALTELETKFNNLIEDAPEAYDTLKEISQYIATHGNEYDALLAITSNKVTKVDGKDLSTNDFTNELKAKLDELYDKATIDSKITEINTKIDNLPSGECNLHCVNSIAERDALITGENAASAKAGMLVYVKGTPASEGVEAVAGKTYQLNDDMTTWSEFKGSLSQSDMTTIVSYVQDNLEHSTFTEEEDGTCYLTLL